MNEQDDAALADLLASQQAITTALVALLATHPNREALNGSYQRTDAELTPHIRGLAANGSAPNTKRLLSVIETALRGGFQPRR